MPNSSPLLSETEKNDLVLKIRIVCTGSKITTNPSFIFFRAQNKATRWCSLQYAELKNGIECRSLWEKARIIQNFYLKIQFLCIARAYIVIQKNCKSILYLFRKLRFSLK